MIEEQSRKTILIVDDAPENLDLLSGILKSTYRVKVAKSGEHALKVIAKSAPDLILLDVMMPEMDGYEVCRRLKSDDSTKDIPIIFVTAMEQESDETKGFELGASDYLTKPISPAIAQVRIKTQLALKASLEELRDAYEVIELQKNRMQQELNVGRDIQLAMVPKDFPKSNNFSVHATLEPAREVGGDFYDVFSIDDDHICLCIGDVSGKGVPAALFMAVAKTLINSRASSDSSTARIVTHANDELSKDNDGCLFVTLFVCILNTRTGELMTTNAGHNPPFLKHIDGSITVLPRCNGPGVAVIEGATYTEDKIQLRDGDILLLFTDGVTEADDIDGKLLGDDRLRKILADWRNSSMEGLVKHIVNETHKYEGENRQADDITVLGLNYIGHDAVDKADFELIIKNELANIDLVNDRFKSFAKGKEIPERVISTICMVFDDLLTNVISYAFRDNEQHDIGIQLSLKKNSIVIVIVDDGLPFNPFQVDVPETQLSIEERDFGGLGIHLVREMMDDVSYQRKDNQNIVTLTKNLEKVFS
jgi:sigma-B regulation protein RsbU (phosphoserine phosphatase)